MPITSSVGCLGRIQAAPGRSRQQHPSARRGYGSGMTAPGLIDSGWAAWLPAELLDALETLPGTAAPRRALARRLAEGPGPDERARWDRFALVCPSRVDLPASADGLTAEDCRALLADLGLVAGTPPRPVANPDPVELTLSL